MLASAGKFAINSDLDLYKSGKLVTKGVLAVNKHGDYIGLDGTLFNFQAHKLTKKRYKKLEGDYRLSITGELTTIFSNKVLFEGIREVKEAFVIDSEYNLCRIDEERKPCKLLPVTFKGNAFKVLEILAHGKHGYLTSFLIVREHSTKKHLKITLSWIEIDDVLIELNASFEEKLYYRKLEQTVSFFSQTPIRLRKSAYCCAVAGLLNARPKIPKPIIKIILAQYY